MRARTVATILAGFGVVAVTLARGEALAECPSSCILIPNLGSGALICRTSAVVDTSGGAGSNFGHTQTSGHIDSRAGTTHLYWEGSFQIVSGYLESTDDFSLVGPTGPPLMLTLDLDCSAHVDLTLPTSPGSGGTIDLLVERDAVEIAHGHFDLGSGGPVSVDTSLAIPLTLIPNQSARIRIKIPTNAGDTGIGGGTRSGTCDTRLRFLGVPPGYAVESCKGFGTSVTPTRAVSWGRLKSRYR